jgi:hypothetical protein
MIPGVNDQQNAQNSYKIDPSWFVNGVSFLQFPLFPFSAFFVDKKAT